MLGDAGVGKSTLSISFKSGKPTADKIEATIGFDLWTKTISMDDKLIKALVYDTSGQELFNSISKNYMRQGEGIIIVYDVTDTKSFESVHYWVEQVSELRGDDPCLFIIGNKSDLGDTRVISKEQGRSYAQSVGATFMETSYKDILSVEQAFMIAIKQVYCRRVEEETNRHLLNSRTLSRTAYSRESKNQAGF